MFRPVPTSRGPPLAPANRLVIARRSSGWETMGEALAGLRAGRGEVAVPGVPVATAGAPGETVDAPGRLSSPVNNWK